MCGAVDRSGAPAPRLTTGSIRDAGTAIGFGDKPPPRRANRRHAASGTVPQRHLRIWKWQPVTGRKALAGFVSVEFAIGLRIAGLPIFGTGSAGPWIGQPGIPVLDSENRQIRGDDGKLTFEPSFAWRDRATADAFSKNVIELLLRQHPDALAGSEIDQHELAL